MNIEELENWANENYRLSTMTTKGEREKQSKIKITYLHWVTQDSRIYNVHTHTHLLDNGSTVTMDQIRSYFDTIGNYDIYEVLTYCLDIDPDNIPAFVSNQVTTNEYLKVFKASVDTFVIPASMFMFHEINGIYVILVDKQVTKKPSILKTKRVAGNRMYKTTKRVAFRDS